MRIYTNLRVRRGPYGGANAFMRALRGTLERKGVVFANAADRSVDMCLLNALSGELRVDKVRELAKLGRPIVHRKVGFAVSGGPEMRRVSNGVVHGNKLQIDFSPFIHHSIFQSRYSRDVFLSEGFEGPHTIIPNGVDETLFGTVERRFFGLVRRAKEPWDGDSAFRIVISTWSKDIKKGFPEYKRIDGLLDGHDDLRVTLVGNVAEGYAFRNIRVIPPQPHRRLARIFRRQHAMLFLAQEETCSNALLEGINCGLPIIYLDSGSNRENAEPYGVEYKGDIFEAVSEVKTRYHELVGRIEQNPFRISLVAEKYMTLFQSVIDQHGAT